MPASEGFYRDQKKLHVVFLVSSLAMLGTTIWMMADDHYRSWKRPQEEFFRIRREQVVDEFVRAEQQIDEAKRADLKARLEEKKKTLTEQAGELAKYEAELSTRGARFLQAEQAVQFINADLAAEASKYDLAVKELESISEKTQARRHARFVAKRDAARKEIDDLNGRLAEAMKEKEQSEQARDETMVEIERLNSGVAEVEEELKELTDDSEKIKRSLESADYSLAARVRALPVIDGFASPLKVQQIALEGLPLDYNFKKVTRYDRCMTCHLGIDKKGFEKSEGVPEPFCAHPELDLYVGADSPHPVEKFGCTICHQGQGSATSFDWASHTPHDRAQEKEWTEKHGWFFNHFHEQPMFPDRFIESSCLKCHHDPFQIPQAKKLLLGYQTIVRYGCYGCHEMNGFKDGAQVAMNLRIAGKNDSEEERNHAMRRVGPNLMRIAEKLDEEFVFKWIVDPQAFRPSSKMPRFYDQLRLDADGVPKFFGEGPKGEFDDADDPHAPADLAYTEIHAITKYLFEKSKAYLADPATPKLPDVTAKGDVAKGKVLFADKGCLACHNHKDVASLEATNFGPELSEVSAKFSGENGYAWLVNWLRDPASYHPESYMPNLQLTEQESADITTYLRSIDGKWNREIEIPPLEPEALRDLLVALDSKMAKSKSKLVAEINAMSQDEQLIYLGEKTINRLGCFGCHNVPGIKTTKPIGTPLDQWGSKNPHQLAFENVIEYVEDHLEKVPAEERKEEFYVKNDYYLDQMHHHQRAGFLMQKLREPRSYDYKKLRRWEERARMPKFSFTDEQREAVATVVLGLTGELIKPPYVYDPGLPKQAEVKGRRLMDKYNCVGCHVIKPGQYEYRATEEQAQELAARGKGQFESEYSFPGHPVWSVPEVNAGATMLLSAMPDGREDPDEAEDPDDPFVYYRLWEATSVLGQVLPAGNRIQMKGSQVDGKQQPYGGGFALWLTGDLVRRSGENTAAPGGWDKAWQKAPPPLIREGEKVQTPWLYRFLRDPEKIRPGVVLRMPRFNYRAGDVEALADYFAAADGTPFPYIEVPQRESTYLAAQDRKHADYLKKGLDLTTNKDLCIKCHEVGGFNPSGKPEELGPRLTRAPERLRPDWMQRWITNPPRMLPYTQMPVNFPKDKAATPEIRAILDGAGDELTRAVRDALINYDRVVDEYLVPRRKAPAATAAATQGEGE